ncbi:MAG: S8 family serine peptidase [Ignavibacteria bacterium]|nr:S8 family serine peptidase [Ignavibacteria bacterium]
MKKIIYVFFLFCLPVIIFAGNEEYYPNKIVVKFKKYSQTANKWKAENRQTSFIEFEKIIGKNTGVPFISDNLLKLYNSAIIKKRQKNASGSKEINLDLIAVIDYKKSIDPFVAARKIANYPDIEYAEPLFIHKLLEITNDPLFTEQNYIEQIKANLAWNYIDTNITIIVGVVDTGIDYLHEDLKDNIYYNEGEMGFDEHGNDKRNNGIDDDGNGFVDDWRGWDFYGDGDNDPMPGHSHGTHVAGIIGAVANNGTGIAGVARNIKLLPVKIGSDIPNATNIANGYAGILYAASMGAKVVNCSWGGTHYSSAEADIIRATNELGSLIVAAAGNNNQYLIFYPAAYDGVMSVAAVDSEDKRAYFTNYHYKIDVSAPGVEILSTVPDNEYRKMSGTSMASPVAAAVAALAMNRFPGKPNFVIREIVKASSDYIDYNNPYYSGMLGKGRVNALRVMTDNSFLSLKVLSLQNTGKTNSNEYFPNDTIKFKVAIINYLNDAENVRIKIYTTNSNYVTVINDTCYIGKINSSEIAQTNEFAFIVNNANEYDKEIRLVVRIIADGYISDNFAYEAIISPSYRTFDKNNVTVSINSIGNIGYNDYPKNQQGKGIRYKDSESMAYEGALLMSVNGNELYNVSRGEYQMRKDLDFEIIKTMNLNSPGVFGDAEGGCLFETINDDTLNVSKLRISQSNYQFKKKEIENTIFTFYKVYNLSNKEIDSVYLGLYFDWDIGSPQRNFIRWDEQQNIAIAKSIDEGLPIGAVVNLSQFNNGFFAIDNDGNSEENPGVYDGFTREEKLRFLKSGVQRQQSSITDASMVISAGPFKLAAGDSAIVPFAIVLGMDEQNIVAEASYAKSFVNQIISASVEIRDKANIFKVYPNPATRQIFLELSFAKNTVGRISIYNELGREEKILDEKKFISSGINTFTYDISELTTGMHFLRITFDDGTVLSTKIILVD